MTGFVKAARAEFWLETRHWQGTAKAVLVILAGLAVVLASVLWRGYVDGLGASLIFAYFASFAYPIVDGFFSVVREWRWGTAVLSLTVPAPRSALLMGKGLATWVRFVALQAFALVVLLALGLGVAYVQPNALRASGLIIWGQGPQQMLMYWSHYAVPISLAIILLAPVLAAAGQLMALVQLWFNRSLWAWVANAGLVVAGYEILLWWASETHVVTLPEGNSMVLDPIAAALGLPRWSVPVFRGIPPVSVWIFVFGWVAAAMLAGAAAFLWAGRVDARPLARR